MREILFRGKPTDKETIIGNDFFYGDLIHYYTGGLAIRQQETGTELEVQANTVGQYTGLTDKNGEKIFEKQISKNNDIVCVYKNFIYLCNILNGDINLNFIDYEQERDFEELSENEKRSANEYIQQAERAFDTQRISFSFV